MMTSNRPLEDWGKLLGDVPSATAILDRFLHHAEILSITRRSYRLKDRAGQEAGARESGAKASAGRERSSKPEKQEPTPADPCLQPAS